MQSDMAGGNNGNGWPSGMPLQLTLLGLSVAEVNAAIHAGRLLPGDMRAAQALDERCPRTLPLVLSPASCGFPSPADDYLDRPLNFHDLLVSNEAATFAVWIDGDSMKDAGIFHKDLAIIDRSLTARHGCIVLALLDGEFTVKRYLLTAGGVVLHPENRAYPDLPVHEGQEFEVWGVVKHTVRMEF